MTRYKHDSIGQTIVYGIVGCLTVIALLILAYALSGLLIMVAWNVVMPAVFGLPSLTWPMGMATAFLLSLIGGIVRGGSK